MPIIEQTPQNIDTYEPDQKTLARCIAKHRAQLWRLDRLHDYYIGNHAITARSMTDGLPNNRIVANYPRYIVEIAAGYLAGKPLAYSATDGADITPATDILLHSRVQRANGQVAKLCSIFGIAHELLYFDKNANIKVAPLDPRASFLVCDDTIERTPLFGVHYYLRAGGRDYSVNVYTKTSTYEYTTRDFTTFLLDNQSEHFIGELPFVEYANNSEGTGDFENVVSLIDAYNQAMSDRINAKEQDIDAIFALYGVENPSREFVTTLRKERVMTLPTDARAEWLVKRLSEQDNEIVRNAIKSDIHKFAMVPDMSDENFSQNSSGVAMRYKIVGFEQLTALKEQYFKEGLVRRLAIISSALAVKGYQTFNPECVEITFSRNLPVNEAELAQMVATLGGIVSQQTLLAQLPFINNPALEAAQAAKEAAQDLGVRA